MKSARERWRSLASFNLTHYDWSSPNWRLWPQYSRPPRGLARRHRRPVSTSPPHRLIDPFQEKIEELVERSNGAVRVDKVYERLITMGFAGDERTTRRAVAEAKEAWRSGTRRRYRPWVSEQAMWLRFD